MLKDEIILRLERIAKHAVHIKGEEPYIMSLDDGVAILDAIDMIKTKYTVETCAQPEHETGRWHKKGGMIYCSKCSTGFEMYFVNDFIYCPHCGERKKGTDE